MKNKFLLIFIVLVTMFSSLDAIAHSGRTDSRGGHKDNQNKSGLGSYHYHCGGYPAHLHPDGVCPYDSSDSGSSSSSSNSSSSSSTYTKPSTPSPVYVEKITFENAPQHLKSGDTMTLKWSMYPSNAINKQIKFTSTNESIVSINSEGVMKATGVGTVTILAQASKEVVSSFELTVREVVAESFKIKHKPETLLIGSSEQLSIELLPDNVTYKKITWESSDEAIATIDQNGLIKSLGLGTVTITAKQKDITDSFTLTVLPIKAEKVYITDFHDNDNISIRDKIQFSATVSPDDTTDKSITWLTNNSQIATIDQSGILDVKNSGEIVIIAQTENGKASLMKLDIYKKYWKISIKMLGIYN